MKLLVLILCLFGLVYGQCDGFTNSNCSACTSSQGCGWCTTVQTCMPGTINGPTLGKCLGPAWQFGEGRCARCSSFTDCRQCLVNAADCGWCTSTKECRPLSGFTGENPCLLALNCPCEVYKNCDQCTDGPNCQWCLGDSQCKSVTDTCVQGPGYNKTQPCPCSVYQTCPACGDADRCQWCQNSGKQRCEEYGTNGTACQISLGSCNAFCSQQGNSSCSKCNDISGCGWCSQSQQCVDVSTTTCPLMHNCESCENHKYCEPCGDDANCNWCESTGTCMSKKYPPVPCTQVATSCSTYCADAGSCLSCNDRKGCGWCSGTSQCLDIVESSCDGLWVHTCDITPLTPPKKCSFDGGAFVGGMFLVIGIIVLGALIYIVYRWKTGKKILYTELR